MTLVSVIPARGGSKGIPNKNLEKLGELSLVELAIKFSVSLNFVNETILSSDSLEILKVANNYSNVVLHERASHLAQDDSTTDDLLLSIIDNFCLKSSDVILLLEPTSPFRTRATFDKAYSEFINSNCDTLITVVRDSSAFWMRDVNNHLIRAFNNTSSRRQERMPVFRELGVFYFIKVGALKRSRRIAEIRNIFALEVSGIEQIDINTPLDLQIAQQVTAFSLS